MNTASLGHEGGDLLTSLDGLRKLVADREHLNHGITRADLDALLHAAGRVPLLLRGLPRRGTGRTPPSG